MCGVTVITTSLWRSVVLGVAKNRPSIGISPMIGIPRTLLDSMFWLTPAIRVVWPSFMRATELIVRWLKIGVSESGLSTEDDSIFILLCTSSLYTFGVS